MNLRDRLARLEGKRTKTFQYPNLVMELSDGRVFDFFNDPEVLDLMGWGDKPSTLDCEIVDMRLEPRRQ
jgi:hypothetical protein